MASKIPVLKESSHGEEKRSQNQPGESGSLWNSQDEMRRYVSRLKGELAEQKNRVKRVHRDKAEEIKRLQESLDSEKQKAIENVSKKLESDKAYELKKMKESVARQKESELRQVLRVKDEEMRALKMELQENKNNSRILELENKRIMTEQSRGETNESERRWKSEISSLRNEKRRLEENLRIKSEADFEKAELIRIMKQEHESEIRRLTKESKRESLKEFRQLKAVSREIELKNHQLAAKDAEMKRLKREKNDLGNELSLQRRGSLKKSNSFNSPKVKGGGSTSINSESDFDSVAEEKIKKLKMRNSELVAIARKLEEKAKQLQEEKDLLEKSNEMNNPDVGNLKKAFARQRARDLAERAKLLINKDNEINNLKKEVEETRQNGYNENGCAEELEKILNQTSKEHLLLQKQTSLKIESLMEETKDLRVQNTNLANDNDVLKKRVSKLQDIESKYHTMLLTMKKTKERNETLENACSEKDKRLYKLELEKQAYTAKNSTLEKENNELLLKVENLEKVEQEFSNLKESVRTLRCENSEVKEENEKLRKDTESLSQVKQDIETLQRHNNELEDERNNVLLKLEERDREVQSLREAQEIAQRKYSKDVSALEDEIQRLKEQIDRNDESRNSKDIGDSKSSVLTSTPKDSKCTQTSRPSSPVMSPITQNGLQELQLLNVPYNGTSSSTSFDLENAGTRIQQLAASDSDEVDCKKVERAENEFPASSEISEYSEDASGEGAESELDTSYSADVSQASDVEEAATEKTLQDDQQEYEDPRDNLDIYIGSPLQDLEEKLSIFIAKYNYDPMLYSPNENPEMELAFQAGDYLYVYGDIDEDGFFVGELMNGERGLVPSNFVERIAEEEAILKESDEIGDNESEEDSSDEEITFKDEDGKTKVIRPKAFSERRHEWYRASLDHVLTEKMDDIRESDEDDLGASSHSGDELGNRNKPEADQISSEGFVSTDSDVPTPRVPSPTKLSLDRQFTNSALISWRGAQLPGEDIQGYNIYVDGKFTTQVKGSKKTNVVVEDIKPSETYRLSVRTKTVTGVESPDHEATMVFGPDAVLSPSNLRIVKITATSSEVHWLPAHSSYLHEVFLNESLLECVKAGCSSCTINNLTPDTKYCLQVRTSIPDHLKITVGKISEENLSAETEFTTPAGGLPEPPVDLRLAQRTLKDIVLTWLPVSLSEDGYSNGYKVSGYKVYVNGIYCTETVSACMDNVEISMERLNNLERRHDFSRMCFVVRTLSVLGESVDSNMVDIGSEDFKNCPAEKGSNEVGSSNEKDWTVEKAKKVDMEDDYGKLKSDSDIEVSLPSIASDKCAEKLDSSSENTGQHSEADEKSNNSEEGELRSARKEDDNSVDVKTGSTKIVSSTVVGPALAVRKAPTVTRYEEVETESDSTETRTQETEEETIERFDHLEKEVGKSDVHDCKKEICENVELSPETSEIKENKSADVSSEHARSELQSSQGETSGNLREQNIENDDLKKVNNGEMFKEDIAETREEYMSIEQNSQSERETGNHEKHKTDSSPESGMLQNNVSMHENETEKEDEESNLKHFEKLIESGVSKEPGNGLPEQRSYLRVAPLPSESETETEYGPPLSVIDEVDEDNLTDTSNPQTTTENSCSDGESTLSNKQIKSLPKDSSKSSELSASRSRTGTSDDEGFRTEDDVLDLLDDDRSILKDSEGDGEKLVVNNSEGLGTSGVNKDDNVMTNQHNDRTIEDTSVEQDTTDSNTEKHSSETLTVNCIIAEEDNNKSLSQADTESRSLQENEPTTDVDESTENLSESSCPTRTSVKSETSISDDPPEAEHALETIMNTLSLPGNRRMASGESDHGGSIASGQTSDLISEENRSGSEVSGNTTEQVRYFIALYSYDPLSMSPNQDDAEEELPFNEGDVIKVFGDKDDDGFYWGECRLSQGFVPSNMITEMNIDEAEDLFNRANNDVRYNNELNSNGLLNGELDVDVISDNLSCEENDRLSFWENLDTDDHFGGRKMKALYDYDPVRDSPNVDSEVELKFRAKEIIYIFGEMDEDGFFNGELNGVRGLVPSNFLQPFDEFIDDDTSINNNNDSEQSSHSRMSEDIPPRERQSGMNVSTEDSEIQQKKKKNIFSKGKRMFKKAFK